MPQPPRVVRTPVRRCAVAATAVLVAIVAGAALVRGRDRPDGHGLAPDEAVVEHTVDGDTVDVRLAGHDERVRLLGIDTPEIAHEGNEADCFGPEAAQRTAELLPDGTIVRLERDVVARDQYGRLLAYVYRRGDGLLVNVNLVEAGYARPLTIAPNGLMASKIVAAARRAEAADLGLWGACGR